MGPSEEIKEILTHYEIGDLIDYVKDERGYVNISYVIESVLSGEKNKYFLRRYKKGIKEEELLFEHSLINHLVAKNFPYIARVLKTREGKTYLHRFEGEEDREGVFYAIFDFLPGNDKYTWVNPTCNDEEVKSAAEVLAGFHNAVFRFQPQGRRSEPGIIKLLPIIASNVSRFPERNKHTIFDAYLIEHLDRILDNIAYTRAALDKLVCKEIVYLVIHCDYHPGNLKFQDNQVTGLFDFDWSKIDARSFDVALALVYFFMAWEDNNDGKLRLDHSALFLKAYQDALMTTPGVGLLNPIELKYLPHMINASNLYVLNWTVEDYYHKNVDPTEYLVYLRHAVNFIRWVDNPHHWKNLQDTISWATSR